VPWEKPDPLPPSVPLVKQQAEYISLHTHLEVGQYIGEMKVDNWSGSKWEAEFHQKHVLVMTMTIFKNLILEHFLTFERVNLLVFDECHHAVKNHDYVQIMRLFNMWCENPAHDPDDMKILGLTASLIPSKCKPGDLEAKIVELEKTLCCRSQTAEDLREVSRYATKPRECLQIYSDGIKEHVILELKNVLEDPLNFLGKFSRDKRKSLFYDIVKLYLDDCLHILLNLGVWCAHQFASKGLEDIGDKIKDCNGFFLNNWEKSLIYLGKTQLQMFVQDSKKVLQRHGHGLHMVDKVKKLLIQLAICSGEACSSPGASSGVTNKLVGIIFTERRTTAALLCELLQHQSKKKAELRHIKCDYVVGHDPKLSLTYLRKEARMNSKKQETVLGKFRKGTINLLVSTSVVEEGVDVPECNTVIRFDFPQNFRSYVQSKGRARAQKSQYILLIPEEETTKLCSELKDYNCLVRELEMLCHERHTSESDKFLMDLVEPYINKDGAIATISSSLSLVHR
jgi:endoribonuclease Dicer